MNDAIPKPIPLPERLPVVDHAALIKEARQALKLTGTTVHLELLERLIDVLSRAIDYQEGRPTDVFDKAAWLARERRMSAPELLAFLVKREFDDRAPPSVKAAMAELVKARN